MSDPDPAPQEPKPEQLNYATPVVSERGHPLNVLLGLVCSGFFWLVAVFVSGALFATFFPQVNSRAVPVTAGIILLGIGGAATVSLFLRRHRRFFVLGWLLGTAIMGLLQGLCFISI